MYIEMYEGEIIMDLENKLCAFLIYNISFDMCFCNVSILFICFPYFDLELLLLLLEFPLITNVQHNNLFKKMIDKWFMYLE